jgi:hypothetical protein
MVNLIQVVLIKAFYMKFKKWLFREMFNNPLPIKWKQRNNSTWEGTFAINDKQYLIMMMNEPQMGWEVKFELLRQGKWTQSITGTGDAAHVFSTVLAGIKEWMAKMQPSQFALTAREPSRKKLYARLLRMLPKNWKVEDMGQTFFVQDSSKSAYGGFSDDGFDDYYDDDFDY